MNNFDGLTSGRSAEQQSGTRRLLNLGCLLPVLGLGAMVAMCAFAAVIFVPTATVISFSPNATRTPLPRLTATPLPTLTPTASAEQVAVAGLSASSEPANAARSNGFAPAQPNLPNASVPSQAPAQPGRVAKPATSSAFSPVQPLPAYGQFASPYTPPVSANRSAGKSSAYAPAVATPRPTPFSTPGKEVVILPTPGAPQPTATATAAPTQTPTPVPPTATPAPADNVADGGDSDANDAVDTDEPDSNWSFVGVRTDTTIFQNGMLVYGNMVNNSSTAQEIEQVSAIFYDARGNVVGQDNRIDAYWPGYSVPPNGEMPFQLLVNGLSGAADFNLTLGAVSAANPPREDFEFSNLTQSYQNNSYCVGGYLSNPGSQLQEYLVITAVLYDAHDNVINFQDEPVYYPEKVVGDQTYHFKICVGPPYNDVARYEVQAWGF
ncbi:MAG: hypothetical protein D6768_04620 [Chloroflexi bacterium]|nr:MAG: hypothetical protein D6768_04620 [Chloroflexota bacterium]